MGGSLSHAECSFCAIIAGSEPARRVLDRPDVIAFFPIEPATIGHTLVVPRKHIEDVWSLDAGTAHVLADAVLVVARAVRRAFEPEGLNIIQSNGDAATQTVPHIHVHVVPRWKGDDMGPIWPTRRRHDEALLTRAAIKLQQAVGGES